MGFEDIWEAICDGFAYIFTFEWWGDVTEFFGSMFENLSEFSIIGLLFGSIGTLVVFLTRKWMLNSFLQYMTSGKAIFWGAITYLGTFAAGYLLGKRLENT
jgi:hypothetical protein